MYGNLTCKSGKRFPLNGNQTAWFSRPRERKKKKKKRVMKRPEREDGGDSPPSVVQKSQRVEQGTDGQLLSVLSAVSKSLPRRQFLSPCVIVSNDSVVFQYTTFPIEFCEESCIEVCPFCSGHHDPSSTVLRLNVNQGQFVAECALGGEPNRVHVPAEIPSLDDLKRLCCNRARPQELLLFTDVKQFNRFSEDDVWRILALCSEPVCRTPIALSEGKRQCSVCYSAPTVGLLAAVSQIDRALQHQETTSADVFVVKQCHLCKKHLLNSSKHSVHNCPHCKGDTGAQKALQKPLDVLRRDGEMQPWERALHHRTRLVGSIDSRIVVVCNDGNQCSQYRSLKDFFTQGRQLSVCGQGHSMKSLVLPSGDYDYDESRLEKGASFLGAACATCKVGQRLSQNCCCHCREPLFPDDVFSFVLVSWIDVLRSFVSVVAEEDASVAHVKDLFAPYELRNDSRVDDSDFKPEGPFDGCSEKEDEIRKLLSLGPSSMFWGEKGGPVPLKRCANFRIHALGMTTNAKGKFIYVTRFNNAQQPLLLEDSELDNIDALCEVLNRCYPDAFARCTKSRAGNAMCRLVRHACGNVRFVCSSYVGTVQAPDGSAIFGLSSALQWSRSSGVQLDWSQSRVIVQSNLAVCTTTTPSVFTPTVEPLRCIHAWVRKAWGGHNAMQVLALFGYGVMCLFRSELMGMFSKTSSGFPCCWNHGTSGGTGKTTACKLVSAMFGLEDDCNVVSEITIAALYQKVSSMKDCFIVVDDMNVDGSGGGNASSKKKAEGVYTLAHNLFDGKPREVFGRGGSSQVYPVRSGTAFCTNFDPPQLGPQRRRLLLNHFHARPKKGSTPSSLQEEELQTSCQRAFLALPVFLSRVRIDLREVDRLQEQYVAKCGELISESEKWYAWWLYFIIQYAKYVLEMGEEEVVQRFMSEVVLGDTPVLEKVCCLVSCWKSQSRPDFLASQDPLKQLQAWAPKNTLFWQDATSCPRNSNMPSVLVCVSPKFGDVPGYKTVCAIQRHNSALTKYYYSLLKEDQVAGAYLVFFERASEQSADASSPMEDSSAITTLEEEPRHVKAKEALSGKELLLWMVTHSGSRFWIKFDLENSGVGDELTDLLNKFERGGATFKIKAKSVAAKMVQEKTGKNTGKDIALVSIDADVVRDKIKWQIV